MNTLKYILKLKEKSIKYYRQLEELVRAKADQIKAAHVAIVILAVHLPNVAVPVRPHQHVQLLPYRIHDVPSQPLSFSLSLERSSQSEICRAFALGGKGRRSRVWLPIREAVRVFLYALALLCTTTRTGACPVISSTGYNLNIYFFFFFYHYLLFLFRKIPCHFFMRKKYKNNVCVTLLFIYRCLSQKFGSLCP